MIWQVSPAPDQEITNRLMSDLGVDHSIASLLAQRGIHSFEEAKAFFSTSIKTTS